MSLPPLPKECSAPSGTVAAASLKATVVLEPLLLRKKDEPESSGVAKAAASLTEVVGLEPLLLRRNEDDDPDSCAFG